MTDFTELFLALLKENNHFLSRPADDILLIESDKDVEQAILSFFLLYKLIDVYNKLHKAISAYKSINQVGEQWMS